MKRGRTSSHTNSTGQVAAIKHLSVRMERKKLGVETFNVANSVAHSCHDAMKVVRQQRHHEVEAPGKDIPQMMFPDVMVTNERQRCRCILRHAHDDTAQHTGAASADAAAATNMMTHGGAVHAPPCAEKNINAKREVL